MLKFGLGDFKKQIDDLVVTKFISSIEVTHFKAEVNSSDFTIGHAFSFSLKVLGSL